MNTVNEFMTERGVRLAALVVGGGAQGITEWLTVGGASSWFEAMEVPYGHRAMCKFLGREKPPGVNDGATCAMANHLWNKHFSGMDADGHKKIDIAFAFNSKLMVRGERPDREHQLYWAFWARTYTPNSSFYASARHGREVPVGHTRRLQEQWAAKRVQDIILANIETLGR